MVMTATKERVLQDGKSFLKFVNASPSPFHAVDEMIQRLTSAGFKELSERNAFNAQPNGKYYFTRNKSCLIAFAVGIIYIYIYIYIFQNTNYYFRMNLTTRVSSFHQQIIALTFFSYYLRKHSSICLSLLKHFKKQICLYK